MNTLSCQVQVISNEHDAGTVLFLKFGSNVAMLRCAGTVRSTFV